MFPFQLTSRQSDSVSFVINKPTNFVEITVSLHPVLNSGGFHEEGVVAFLQDSFDTLVIRLREDTWPCLHHRGRHTLISRVVGILEWNKMSVKNIHVLVSTIAKDGLGTWKVTLKKADVDPPATAPYLILVCLARSSTPLIGVSILSTVRNAAKLAVYDETMINVKNHHIPATIRIEGALWGIEIASKWRMLFEKRIFLYLRIFQSRLVYLTFT